MFRGLMLSYTLLQSKQIHVIYLAELPPLTFVAVFFNINLYFIASTIFSTQSLKIAVPGFKLTLLCDLIF